MFDGSAAPHHRMRDLGSHQKRLIRADGEDRITHQQPQLPLEAEEVLLSAGVQMHVLIDPGWDRGAEANVSPVVGGAVEPWGHDIAGPVLESVFGADGL